MVGRGRGGGGVGYAWSGHTVRWATDPRRREGRRAKTGDTAFANDRLRPDQPFPETVPGLT